MRSFCVLLTLFMFTSVGQDAHAADRIPPATRTPKNVICPAAMANKVNGTYFKRSAATCFPSAKAAEKAGYLPQQNTPNSAPTPLACSTPASLATGVIGINEFHTLEGNRIIAKNGQFLGIFSRDASRFDAIANPFGPYGSNTSPTSIFNDLGAYGGSVSSLSPFNSASSTPPTISIGQNVYYLTTSKFITPRINPLLLKVWFQLEDY